MHEPSIRANIITRRTYNRPLNAEGTEVETWEDTIDRVIDHQRWLWERALTSQVLKGMPLHDITEDLSEWVMLDNNQMRELSELRNIFLYRKGSLSGRTLWLGGTNIAKKREASQFNCAHTITETVYDVVDIFWLLLQGCGVGATPMSRTLTGFRSPIRNIRVIRSEKSIDNWVKGRETNEEHIENDTWYISVGDSAEAWAKAVGKLLANKYKVSNLVFDLREIRPAGVTLSGYGWISSGDGPFSYALRDISRIMNYRAGSLLRKVDIVEILNHLGTVLSSRRSAEIMLMEYGDPEWKEFAKFKRNCNDEGYRHRQQSNNSLVLYDTPSKEQLSEIFDMMIESGGSEPGFINGKAAKLRAPWFSGVNPCGEILLGNKSFCNLAELDLSKYIGDAAGMHRDITLLARANYRQTVVDFRDGILQEAWHTNNEFLRLCGTGVTGIVTRDDMTEYDWKTLKYSAVTAARSMAKELQLEHPKNVTTVKPSGTLSKIMDTTEGVHKPESRFMFNWVNFSKHNPIVKKLKDANYNWIENPTDETGVIVCIPIKFDNVEFSKKEVTRKDGTKEVLEVNLESAIVQLDRYKKIQTHYCDQNVSCTIYYKPEEKEEITEWMLTNWDVVVGLSFLFKNDPTVSAKDLGYSYLPQEYVSEEVYTRYVNTLKDIEWDESEEYFEEEDDQECEGGACPVK